MVQTLRDIGKMTVDDMMCMHCGACVGTCPENAMFLNEVFITINEDCNQCGLCMRVCPVGAMDYPTGHKLSQLG